MAICHELDPTDPLRVAVNTNEYAERSRLLAKVPMATLFGSCTKGHMLSFLQALKSGTVYWSDTGTLMLPSPAKSTLAEMVELGLTYMVLSW